MKLSPQKMKTNVTLDMNRQKILNFNPSVINVWNCHFKKNTRGRSQLNFLYGSEMNTVAQYSNFTIFKIKITTKDTFKSPGQYMLSFKNSDRLFHFNNNGFNQIDFTLNWALDNNSLLNYVYLRKSESGISRTNISYCICQITTITRLKNIYRNCIMSKKDIQF